MLCTPLILLVDCIQVASIVCEGTEYTLGDFMLRICRLVLKPGEEVKGVMMDVEYFPSNSSTHAHPALQVRTSSFSHLAVSHCTVVLPYMYNCLTKVIINLHEGNCDGIMSLQPAMCTWSMLGGC